MHRLATRLRAHLKGRSRGQSLVEFGLVLPIILLLTLAALDFGRIYLGYINIQNMARIAANFAANNPDAWADAHVQKMASYQNQILGDAAATNCHLPIVSGVETAPPPVFSDADADGVYEVGDTARVSLTCTFNVITPVIANIVGGSIPVSASSEFPVKSSMTSNGPGGGPGTPPVAAFTGNTTIAPSSLSGVAPFTVMFRDTSGGAPISWSWAFPDDLTTSNLRDLPHTFLTAGTFLVEMTATNSLGSDSEWMSVTVTDAEDVDFAADFTSIMAGDEVTFTDLSTAGGSNPTWTFGAGEGVGTGSPVTHTYNTPGTYEVSLTVTYASGAKTLTRPGYITVDVALCNVPSFDGFRRNDAAGRWTDFGFSGTVTDGPKAPSGNYFINTQSITALTDVPCNSNIVVNRQ